MSRKKNGRESASEKTPVESGHVPGPAAAEAESGEPVRVRKVLPPEGHNALLDLYVKVGEEFEVSPAVADDLLRHGEFEAVE